jgi:predicted short-subunit dehydrogenase-like oxidoreductase (DUF2520 family)
MADEAKKRTVVLIGAGNVASHLAEALSGNAYKIIQIWSRHIEHAEKLAKITGAEGTSDLSKISRNADIYIIAIPDDQIKTIWTKLDDAAGILCHTSASTELLPRGSKNKGSGVLYPLQTFTEDSAVSVQHIPFLVEGDDKNTEKEMKMLAAGFESALVHIASAEERKALHIAAVIVCNFPNHLYQLAEEFLKEKNLPLSLLEPLIFQTTYKALGDGPAKSQTGPARRGDAKVIQKHLDALEKHPELKEIYALLTKSIIRKFDK